MKILMVSAGLRPQRGGGIPAYVEELMDELRRRGHQIVYLDTSGSGGWLRAAVQPTPPVAGGCRGYRLINSGVPIPWHREVWPLRQVTATTGVREAFRTLIEREKPDLVHLHELLCLPIDIVSWLKQLGCTVLFTAQDYFALCPTIKLFRSDGLNCTLPDEALICHVCCSVNPPPWQRALQRFAGRRWVRLLRLRAPLDAAANFLRARLARPALAEAYHQRRRDYRRCLEAIDLVLCMSRLHLETMRAVLGPRARLRLMYLSRRTYAPRPLPRSPAKSSGDGAIVFVALNVGDPTKGGPYLVDVFTQLERQGARFELRLYGAQGIGTRQIRYLPGYRDEDLDRIVTEADYGVVPSLWREAYGYVGAEMLSRGLPLLVSARGAMPEYISHGHNGFVFDPADAASLREIVLALLNDADLRERVRSGAAEAPPFAFFDAHVDEVEQLYAEFISPSRLQAASLESLNHPAQ